MIIILQYAFFIFVVFQNTGQNIHSQNFFQELDYNYQLFT
ncbi:hypothetical protein pb186bvf_000539 [Paramecium bursaria]